MRAVSRFAIKNKPLRSQFSFFLWGEANFSRYSVAIITRLVSLSLSKDEEKAKNEFFIN
jgi:hypothetical protein